jgi:phage-related protein
VEWIVDYYRDANGNEPVKEFLNSLSLPAKAKMMRQIELLTERGVLLKEPYTRHIKGKLRELRIKDSHGAVRVLYFTYTGRRFILLHGFIKKTEKTPDREIKIAEKRMGDYINTQRG